MSNNRKQTLIKRKHLIEDVGHCELCGSKRNLEVHHIIPLVCSLETFDLDIQDNWIVVCGVCHARLTSRSLLTKYGLRKTIEKQNRVKEFYSRINEIADESVCIEDILDIFDELFTPKEKVMAL